MACNGVAVLSGRGDMEEPLRQLGVGLYPALAAINHACRPTAMVVFQEGGAATLRAIRDIPVGEEVDYVHSLVAGELKLHHGYRLPFAMWIHGSEWKTCRNGWSNNFHFDVHARHVLFIYYKPLEG